MLGQRQQGFIEKLRREMSTEMLSEARLIHTYEVEKMAARLAELYAPELEYEIRAAALLHDLTKELTTEEHYAVLCTHGESEYLELPKRTLHARSAVYVILDSYSEYASDIVLSAVRYHTTGRADMTIAEKIIYFADYIDLSRTHKSCVELREMFWSADIEKMSTGERLAHLDECILASFDMTIKLLIENGNKISLDTIEARNYLLRGIKRGEKNDRKK